MSSLRNCELSAALGRLVDAPAVIDMVISPASISWIITDELDGIDRMALTAAIVRELDDTGVQVGVGTIRGRFNGVQFTCSITVPAQTAHPSMSGRHLAVVR
jgi:hypothetical protein